MNSTIVTEILDLDRQAPSSPGLHAGRRSRREFGLEGQGRAEATATEPGSGQAVRPEVETASVMSAEQMQEAKARGLAIAVS